MIVESYLIDRVESAWILMEEIVILELVNMLKFY